MSINAKKISILLPNLNNREFLEERIESIYNQTFSDWELIIVDGYSDDGAWEYFQGLSRLDKRIKLSQAPREGIYAGWNECIRQAGSEYIYIATSDDTMDRECLEKLSKALDQNRECGMAHCQLKYFDENSNEILKNNWATGLFAQSSGGFFNRKHVRKAPYDGLLHLTGQMVYISITQLMVRRKVFEEIGLFPIDRGSIADFYWAMKATLLNDTVHVPDTWGGWRLHRKQATNSNRIGSYSHFQDIESIIECVLREGGDWVDGNAKILINSPSALTYLRRKRLRAALANHGRLFWLKCIAQLLKQDPRICIEILKTKIQTITQKPDKTVNSWNAYLKTKGIRPQLIDASR